MNKRITLSASLALGICQLNLLVVADESVIKPTNIIEVTGSRFTSSNLRLPSHYRVIDKEEIIRSNASQLSQLLATVAGVQVSIIAGKTVLSMRGVSAEQAANNLLILLDGRRINNTDIAAPDLESIVVSDIERIEVIQGAASSLYGDQAVAGVINIITNDAHSKEQSLSALLGSYSKHQLSTRLANKLTDNWAWSLSANRLKSDNYRENNQTNLKQATVKLNYKSEHSDWLLELASSNEHLSTPGALLESDLVDPRQSRPEFNNDFVDTKQQRVRLLAQQSINDNWQYAFDINYADFNIESINSFVNFATTQLNLTDRRQLSFYPRIKGRWLTDNGAISWVSGLDWDESDYQFSLLSRANEQTIKSLYSQLYLPLTKSTELELAARYARTSDLLQDSFLYPNGVSIDNSATAFDIGLNHSFSGINRVFARFSNNFRFAKVDEQAYTEPSVIGLEPQTGDSLEFGYALNQNDSQLQVSIYRLKLEDEIFFNPSASAPIGAFFPGANVNGQASDRKGLLIDFQAAISPQFLFAANYQYVDATLSTESGNKKVPFVAKHSANVRLNWQLSPHVNSYFEADYHSGKLQAGDISNTLKPLKEVTVFNLALNWQQDKVRLSLRVDNLLDEHYNQFAQYNGFYPANGRNGTLNINYSF